MKSNGWESDRTVTDIGLEPASAGVVKTLPGAVYRVSERSLDSQTFSDVTGANNCYLQITWNEIFDRVAAFSVFLAIAPVLVIASVFLLILLFSGVNIGAGISVVMVALLLFVLFLVFLVGKSFFYFPRGETVRFCRQSKKVYKAYAPRKQVIGFVVPTKRRAEIVAYDWANVRAEITKGYYATGATAGRLHFLQLAVLDPQTKQVIDRFIIGKKSFVGFADRVQLWELIRRYMQEPDRKWDYVPTNVYRESSFESFDYANPVSIFLRNETTPAFFIGLFGWLLTPVMALAGVSRWIIFHLTTAPDWRELDRTVFQYPEQGDEQKPNLSAAERKRRVRWMWVWVLSVGLVMAGFVAIAVMHSRV